MVENGHRIQIVGGQQVISSAGNLEDLMRFYSGLFGRMKNEVKNTGELTRYIGYQSNINEKDTLCFLGIEVDGIENIPQGMSAWDLNDRTWTLWQMKNGHKVIVWQKDITWQWINKLPFGKARCTGEFSVMGPLELPAGEMLQCRDFWMSANAYVGVNEKSVSDDEVLLADYDLSWPRQFEETARWLREQLTPEIALRIEHYGSTAIPGMPAKPIIDIMVEISSFLEARRHVVALVNNEKWEYWWYLDHMIFIKREKLMGERTCHIHMAPRGHRLWEGLAFRDYLISHKDDALRYAKLKRELAVNYRRDRERYTEAKAAFVKEIAEKASRSI